jgi:RimJ/RimL family protein N-acetyltransferase
MLHLDRCRWEGPLDAEELAWCRANGVPLAFDCAQIGWVTASCRDDTAPELPPQVRAVQDDAETEALRLRDEIRRATKNRAARSTTADAQRQLERSTLATIDEMVLGFAAAHGLRAANALHWLLRAEVAAGWPSPEPKAFPPETTAFAFRPWTNADAPRYRAMLDNARLWQYLPEPFPAPLTEELAQTLIQLGSIGARQETLAVEFDGRPVGQVLLRFDAPFAGVRVAEVAYWLAEEHWGKGWMVPILGAFLGRSVRQHALDVVYAWIHEDNRASVRTAERCGFRRDSFVLLPDLASAMQRPRFLRFGTYRRDWTADVTRGT